MKHKYIHCKMPGNGQSFDYEQQAKFAKNLAHFLANIPRFILEDAITEMYEKYPCTKNFIKETAEID